ncbi:MAG: prepilin-type N-terminal cleavage/methylation domain-containing protein [Deltaproteobacteria bacterium]|jgi:prepilin-type N-terminal cleavage/methylation domain-containing protein|nr:prepilin-type N-terminal cleavage/methylation domain-containing protein [Deltaproteobacteria bacterium]
MTSARPDTTAYKTTPARRDACAGAAAFARRGFTLVELLIVMLMGLVLTGAAFSILRMAGTQYVNEDASLRLNENLRSALRVVSADIRMAGNGISIIGSGRQLIQFYGPTTQTLEGGELTTVAEPGWFRYPGAGSDMGVRAIFGTDGGEDRPDTLTVFWSEIERPSALARALGYETDKIVTDQPIAEGEIAEGDILAVVVGARAAMFEAGHVDPARPEVPVNPEGRYTADRLPPDFSPENGELFNLRRATVVTYYIDTVNSRLMADYHDRTLTDDDYDDPASGSVVIADNIEDLQLYYFFEGDPVDLAEVSGNPGVSWNRFRSNNLKAVAVSLTGRTNAAPSSSPRSNRRPAAFNRRAGTAADQYRRGTLAETVYLRNNL